MFQGNRSHSKLYSDLVRAAEHSVRMVRKGSAAVLATEALEATLDAPLASGLEPESGSVPDSIDETLAAVSGGRSKFDREATIALQLRDPEFGDVMRALRIKKELLDEGKTADEVEVYKELKKQLSETHGPSKRVDTAVKQMGKYELDGLLYRNVLNPTSNEYGKRVVLPAGGLRSFFYNGRRFKLPLRERQSCCYIMILRQWVLTQDSLTHCPKFKMHFGGHR